MIDQIIANLSSSQNVNQDILVSLDECLEKGIEKQFAEKLGEWLKNHDIIVDKDIIKRINVVIENTVLKTVNNKAWIFHCQFENKHIPKEAGFYWHGRGYYCNNGKCFGCKANVPFNVWYTTKREIAVKLIDYADSDCKKSLQSTEQALNNSRAKNIECMDDVKDIPIAKGMKYLPYQLAGINFALKRKNTYIGDEMGLGKTAQALGVVNYDIPKNVLVLCPASLRTNWLNESKRFLAHDREYYVVESDKDNIPNNADFIISSYEIVRLGKHVYSQLMTKNYDIIIMDECHKLKNPKTKQTKHILGYYDSKTRKKVDGLVSKGDKVLALSGTPILNKPIELWPILNAICPEKFNNFMAFGKRYCNGHQMHIGRGRYVWDFNGSSNLSELQDILRINLMVRRLKKDVLPELPPKRRQLVVLPQNGCARIVSRETKVLQQHEERLAQLQAELDLAHASGNKELYQRTLENINKSALLLFEEISKVRHETALAKVPKVIEFIEDMIEQSNEKIIVFAHHKDVIEQITNHFDNCAKIIGGMSNKEKDENKEKFWNDSNCKIIVCSIHAAGVGINLQCANTEIFAELDWVPANINQCEDRAHRLGSTGESINIYHLVLDGSIDERLARTLIDKQNIADSGLDFNGNKAEPVLPLPKKEQSTRPSKYPKASDIERDIAYQCIRILAQRCDGAVSHDNVGFNGCDTKIGHALADYDDFTDGQVYLAMKVINKYRNTQLAQFIGNGGVQIIEKYIEQYC